MRQEVVGKEGCEEGRDEEGSRQEGSQEGRGGQSCKAGGGEEGRCEGLVGAPRGSPRNKPAPRP
jgi:hypothetical protein